MKKDSDILKERIFDIFCQKIVIYGIRSVTIDDICKELTISKKTFYSLFATKGEMISFFLVRIYDEMCVKTRKLFETDSFVEIIDELHLLMRRYRDILETPKIFFDLERYYPSECKSHMEKIRLLDKRVMERIIEVGMGQGYFRKDIDKENIVELLTAMKRFFFVEYLRNSENAKIRKSHEAFLGIFFRGIATTKGYKYIHSEFPFLKQGICRKQNGTDFAASNRSTK